MSEETKKTNRPFDVLEHALEHWARHGNEQPLTRWLAKELDSYGTPIRLPLSDWTDCLKRLLNIDSNGRVWPARWTEPITRLLQATCWFARPDGSPVLDFGTTKTDKRGGFADQTTTSCGGRIVGNWNSKNKGNRSNATRPPWGGSDRVLDVLRPGWPVDDHFLAIDHRDASSACRFELFGAGRSWLGPVWTTDPGTESVSRPKPGSWVSDTTGAVAEWSYRAGLARITQSALILGDRSLALLSMLVENRSPLHDAVSMRISLPTGITPGPIEVSRGIVLKSANHRGSAHVLPIGLPSLPYSTDRGAFLALDNAIVLKEAPAGRSCWLPLLVSWDSKRHRKSVQWRILSVSEQSRNVAPDKAFAVRVSWGRDETYVIYRSFAKPAPRAFLGHQTTARLLVGSFTSDGIVEPIFKVD